MHVMGSLLCLNAKSSYAPLLEEERWMGGWRDGGIDKWMDEKRKRVRERVRGSKRGRMGICFRSTFSFARMSHLFFT